MHFNEIQDGHFTMHKCDNPSCVNPEHLVSGTAKDNAADRAKKGRNNSPTGKFHGSKTCPGRLPVGSCHPNSKLTEESIKEIRALSKIGKSASVIAAKFSVSQSNISVILRGETWAHVK